VAAAGLGAATVALPGPLVLAAEGMVATRQFLLHQEPLIPGVALEVVDLEMLRETPAAQAAPASSSFATSSSK
jgi:hypothetical protein